MKPLHFDYLPWRLAKRFSRDPRIERSLRHSIYSALFFALMTGAGEAYFAAYALFLGASSVQIAILSGLPQMVASLAQWFSAAVGYISHWPRLRLIVLGTGAQGLMWPFIVLLPFVIPPPYQAWVLIIFVTLFYAGTQFAVPHWYSLMADLVPARKRGRYFALRSRLAQIVSFIAMLSAGLVLHLFDTAGSTLWGFVLIFCLAASARGGSVYHQASMHDPRGNAPGLAPDAQLEKWKHFLRSPFGHYSIAMMFMQASIMLASPFLPVLLLTHLHFTYIEFTLVLASTVLVQFMSLPMWGRFSDVHGNRIVIKMCSLLFGLVPLCWLLQGNVVYFILVQGLAGLALGGFNLANNNFIMAEAPKEKRVAYTAMHHVCNHSGLFAGAMLGALIYWFVSQGDDYPANGLLAVFIVSALLRIVTAWWFVGRVRESRKARVWGPPAWLAPLYSRWHRHEPRADCDLARTRRHVFIWRLFKTDSNKIN